jgi:aquaporin Z
MSASIRTSTSQAASTMAAVEEEPQPYAAECLGTAFLVLVGVGAAVLAGQYIGTLGIALAFGLVLMALAYAIGPISGAHVNPAVTLGVLMAGRMDVATAIRYWIAQVVGAIVGAALLLLVTAQVPGLRISDSFGSNGFADRSAVRINLGGAFVAELLLTAVFVYVFLAVTQRLKFVGSAGVPIGLAFASVYLVAIPLTGGSINPVRSFGPAVFAGGSGISQFWLFLVAPMIGGGLAAALHRITHSQTGDGPGLPSTGPRSPDGSGSPSRLRE